MASHSEGSGTVALFAFGVTNCEVNEVNSAEFVVRRVGSEYATVQVGRPEPG